MSRSAQTAKRRKLSALVPLSLLLLAPAGMLHAQESAQGDADAVVELQKLRDVKVSARGNGSRVVVTLEAEAKFTWGELHNPERIYFDLLSTVPTGARQATIDSKGMVQRTRVALFRPTVTRIVLDLPGRAEFETQWLIGPQRLVIDVWPAGTRKKTTPKVTQAKPAPAVVARATPPAPAKKSIRMITLPPARPVPPPPLIDPPKIAATRVPKDWLAKLEPPPGWTLPNVQPPPKPKPVVAKKTPPKPARTETAKTAPPQPVADDTTELGQPAASASTLTRALGLKLRRVVLDAGHGGKDVGTISPKGYYEKDLVLDVTLRLGKLLEERLGSEIVYTRNDDTFIPLHERTQIANAQKADLFLSIHANSSRATTASGFETYYLNLTQTRSDLEVAARENATSDKTISDLNDLVQQITFNEKADESRDFAARMHEATHALEVKNGQSRDRGVKKAPFLVLIGAHMPSVLVEIGFLTNPDEEARMRKPAYRQKIAEALYEGVAGYADTLSHYRTASKQVTAAAEQD